MTKYRVTFITGAGSYETIEVQGLLKLKIVCMGIRAHKFEIHIIEQMEWMQIGPLAQGTILNAAEKKLEE